MPTTNDFHVQAFTGSRRRVFELTLVLLLASLVALAQEEEPRIDPVAPVPEALASGDAVLYPTKVLARFARRAERKRVDRAPRREPAPPEEHEDHSDFPDCVGVPCYDLRFPPEAGDASRTPATVDEPWEINVNKNDPQIAVSRTHVVVIANTLVRAYGKDGGLQLELTIKDLFKPLWDPANPDNINTHLKLPPQLECDATEQYPFVSETFCLDSYYDARVIYDPYRDRFWIGALARNERTRDAVLEVTTTDHSIADEVAGRRSKALLAVSVSDDPRDGFYLYWWDAVADEGACHNDTFTPCPNSLYWPGDGGDYPSLGINKFYFAMSNGVAQRYLDSPTTTAVNARYGRVVIWDADGLASGGGSGWVFQGGQEPGGLKNADGSTVIEGLQPAVQHSVSAYGAIYLTSLHVKSKELVVWAFSSQLGMYRREVTLSDEMLGVNNPPQPPVLPFLDKPKPVSYKNIERLSMKTIYRNFRLYTIWSDCRTWEAAQSECSASNRVVRADMGSYFQGSIPTTPASGFIDRTFGLRNGLDDGPTDVVYYGNPAMEVNVNDTMVFVYSRAGKTVFPEARYSAYFAAEPDLRPSAVLHAGNFPYGDNFNPSTDAVDADGNPAPIGNLDTGGAAVDPYDDTAVWMVQAYSESNGLLPRNQEGLWKLAVAKVFGRRTADLTVPELAAKPSVVSPGGAIDVTLKVTNQGDGDAGATETSLFLSTDGALSGDDTLLGTLTTGALASGSVLLLALNDVPIPSLPSGTYQLLAKADAGGVVVEYSEANNVASKNLRVRRRFRAP